LHNPVWLVQHTQLDGESAVFENMSKISVNSSAKYFARIETPEYRETQFDKSWSLLHTRQIIVLLSSMRLLFSENP